MHHTIKIGFFCLKRSFKKHSLQDASYNKENLFPSPSIPVDPITGWIKEKIFQIDCLSLQKKVPVAAAKKATTFFFTFTEVGSASLLMK